MVGRFHILAFSVLVALAVLEVSEHATDAQTSNTGFYAGRNINMVSGTKKPGETDPQRAALGGDPYLQRQNEPTIAASTRNPLHLMAGANDYRTVDMAIDSQSKGDVWLGLFKSFDGGQSWQSTLLPGFPEALTTQEGVNSPIYGYAAASDPTIRAGTNGMFYYSGIAFNRGTGALGVVFVSRFIDLNNREGAFFNVPANQDPIKYIDTTVVDSGTAGQFMDKPWLAIDIPRGKATTANLLVNDTDASGNPIQVSQSFPCGNAYLAYAVFTGNTVPNVRSKVLLVRSTDCGATWSKPVMIDQSYSISQGPTIAIDPNSGYVYVAWRVFASSSTPDSIVVSMSTNGGNTFSKGVVVANINAFDQATRPAFSGDSFDAFRTNAFPTMAVDNNGRVYIAWSQRGYWGNDNSPQDGIPDGSRIVVSSSTDGSTWSSPVVADNSGVDANGKPTGHQIMPSLSFAGGKLMLLYYDFRDDFYPGLFDLTIPPSLGLTPYDPSLPPEDPLAFDPIPVRHTVDVRIASATGNPATFTGSSLKVTSYLSSIIPNSSGGYTSVQLQSNPVNLPMFDGGQDPFIGDYIEVAAARQIVPDPNNPGKWIFNNSSPDAGVFHSVWADNRNVVPPPPQLTSGGLLRTDWTQYSPPGSCTTGTYPGMRNQDIYSSRLTQGLVMGSLGNFKPLSIQRAFSIFLENTTPQPAPASGASFTPSSRFFRLSISAPGGVSASFNPLSITPLLSSTDVAVANRGKVAVTVFAKASGTTSPNSTLRVTATEITGIGGTVVSGGLQSTLVLNPDPTNPTPLNVDSQNNALATVETHDPQFLPFNCTDFASLTGSGIVNNCQGTATQVSPLTIAWPSVVNPANSSQLNPALLNPALLNPALLNPALLNPALLNPALLNPALLNPALLNPALLNPALLNPALLNPALLNPALLNPALLNYAVLNPALLNPALLNPALLNPALLNPALLNPAPSGADFTSTAYSPTLLQGSVLDPSVSPTTLTDITWQVQNIGNDASSYFFTWLSGILGQQPPAQLLIYRTYRTPLADSSCGLTQNGLNYEFLANVLNPALLTPAQLNSALTFSIAPSDQVFVTLRFLSPAGQPSQQTLNAIQIAAGVLPQAPNTGSLPATATFLTISPNPSTFGQAVTLVASAVPVVGPPASGTVTFMDAGTTLGTGMLNSSGQASFTSSTLTAGTHTITAVYGGSSSLKGSTSQPVVLTVNQATPTVLVTGGTFTYDGYPHPATATVTGTGTSSVAGSFSFSYTPGSSSPPVNAGAYTVTASFTSSDGNYINATGSGSITINKATPTVTITGGPFTYDGNPHPAVASATGVGGVTVTGSFSLSYTPGGSSAPINAGTYAVSAGFTSTDTNYTNAAGSGSITIAAATPTVTVSGGPFTYDGNPHPATGTATGAGGATVAGTFAFTYNPGGSSPPVNAGTYAVTASFTSGNANYGNATGAGSIKINPATPSFSNLSGPTILYGQSPTVLGGVIKAGLVIPTGSVSITLNGSTSSAPIDPATGSFAASFITGQLGVSGSPYVITYSYAGGGNFTGAGPDISRALTVSKASSLTTLLATPNPATIGQQVTFTATVVAVSPGSGIPTGTVTFLDGTTVLGTGALNSSGQASFATSALASGAHTITAAYQGDGDFVGSSTPSPLTLSVVFNFVGFLSPLGPANTSTVYGPFNLGKTVPVKWQLLNAAGSYINDLTTVLTLQAAATQACGDPNGTNPFLLYPSATGGTNLRYDTTNNQYVFNWDTTGRVSGCTYQLSLTLSDGLTRTVLALIQ